MPIFEKLNHTVKYRGRAFLNAKNLQGWREGVDKCGHLLFCIFLVEVAQVLESWVFRIVVCVEAERKIMSFPTESRKLSPMELGDRLEAQIRYKVSDKLTG